MAGTQDATELLADALLEMTERAIAAEQKVERYKAALTPSGHTKAEYIGEVKDSIEVHPESAMCPLMIDHTISWTATKAIMKMIDAYAQRAFLSDPVAGEPKP